MRIELMVATGRITEQEPPNEEPQMRNLVDLLGNERKTVEVQIEGFKPRVGAL